MGSYSSGQARTALNAQSGSPGTPTHSRLRDRLELREAFVEVSADHRVEEELEREEGTANGSGQLRLLARKLESRRELRRDFHPCK
jgi:hypothetical protein